jgi:ABC transporter substrate binding protein (PQQ-dependent alcohol dehydrogenase system)
MRLACLPLRALGLALWLCAAQAAACAATLQVLVVSLRDDPRLERNRIEQAYPGHPLGRPLAAAQLAAEESRPILDAAGHQLKVQGIEWDGRDVGALMAQITQRGASYLLLDLPLAQQQQLMAAFDAQALRPIVFNVAEAADALRGASCHSQWLHTIPSERMQADALSQWLAARGWRDLLWLVGPRPADAQLREVWQASFKRHGVRVKAERRFVLSGDPRQREQGNPRLLTAEPAHDAVLVLDSDGEFARGLPYNAAQPRPVAGHAGLVALAWHPRWERYGGPQLNRRFARLAGRTMVGQDWAAWVAVKAVAAVLEDQPKATLAQQLRALRSGSVTVDGFKGGTVSFRPWDGQLRQPMFLAHGEGVAAVVPLEGAMHPRDVLDTLGADEGESACKRR